MEAGRASIRYQTTDADSFYNGLQLELRKRFSHGYQLQAAYTLSKTIDEGSDLTGGSFFQGGQVSRTIFLWDRHLLRGLASFDVRNLFALNTTYDLPLGPGGRIVSASGGFLGRLPQGWQINAILTLSNGYPLTVSGGFQDQEDYIITTSGLRPDLVPGGNQNPVVGDPLGYFDVNQFRPSELGFFGDLGRNTVIGPGTASLDLSIVKNTKLDERRSLQFRAEFFNLPNFRPPTGEIFIGRGEVDPFGVRLTGTITTSRQIQFGLKFLF